MTGDLSAFAARPFVSLEEASAAVLTAVKDILGMETSFIARTDHGHFEVVAVAADASVLLEPGMTLPLPDSY